MKDRIEIFPEWHFHDGLKYVVSRRRSGIVEFTTVHELALVQFEYVTRRRMSSGTCRMSPTSKLRLNYPSL